MVSRARLLRAVRAPSSSCGIVASGSRRATIAAASAGHASAPAPVARRCIGTSAAGMFAPSARRCSAAALTAETYPALQRDARFAQVSREHVAFFRELLGADAAVIDGVSADAEADLAPFNEDWMHKYRGQCRLVVKPASTEEVSRVLAYCNEQMLAVVPRAATRAWSAARCPFSTRLSSVWRA